MAINGDFATPVQIVLLREEEIIESIHHLTTIESNSVHLSQSVILSGLMTGVKGEKPVLGAISTATESRG